MYTIQEIDIEKLRLNENNPRFIKDQDFKNLVKSLKECPELFQARPLLVNADLMILGGNMRYRAAQELNYKQVPVIILDNLTEEQQREIIIKDNGSFGNWDFEELANGWSDLPLSEWGLDMPVFLDEEEPTIDDLSDKLKSEFRIEIVCKSEEEQEKTYNKLIEQGYECRLLTL